jgi:hypothetical protein
LQSSSNDVLLVGEEAVGADGEVATEDVDVDGGIAGEER